MDARQVGTPSIMKSQRHPASPLAPFKWPTPNAMAPPKAPASVALAMTKAIRRLRSSARYQNAAKV